MLGHILLLLMCVVAAFAQAESKVFASVADTQARYAIVEGTISASQDVVVEVKVEPQNFLFAVNDIEIRQTYRTESEAWPSTAGCPNP